MAASRSNRWFGAVAKGRDALERLEAIKDEAEQDVADALQKVVDDLEIALQTVIQKVTDARDDAQEALDELKDLQSEYQDWYDNMPYQLQDGPTGEKLTEITNLDLEWDPDLEFQVPEMPDVDMDFDLESLENVLDEAEGADLPLGFGRD